MLIAHSKRNRCPLFVDFLTEFNNSFIVSLTIEKKIAETLIFPLQMLDKRMDVL